MYFVCNANMSVIFLFSFFLAVHSIFPSLRLLDLSYHLSVSLLCSYPRSTCVGSVFCSFLFVLLHFVRYFNNKNNYLIQWKTNVFEIIWRKAFKSGQKCKKYQMCYSYPLRTLIFEIIYIYKEPLLVICTNTPRSV